LVSLCYLVFVFCVLIAGSGLVLLWRGGDSFTNLHRLHLFKLTQPQAFKQAVCGTHACVRVTYALRIRPLLADRQALDPRTDAVPGLALQHCLGLHAVPGDALSQHQQTSGNNQSTHFHALNEKQKTESGERGGRYYQCTSRTVYEQFSEEVNGYRNG